MRDEIAEPPNIEFKRNSEDSSAFPWQKKPDQPVDSRITICAQDLAHTNYIHLNQTNSHTHELCNNDCFRPRFFPLKTHTHTHMFVVA